MDAMTAVAERKILEAQRNGAFDDLPGKGKPLSLTDDSGVPEDLRVCYKILKNAGVTPPELELRRELVTLEALVRCCADEAEAARGRQRLSLLRLQLETAVQQRGVRLHPGYADTVYTRFT